MKITIEDDINKAFYPIFQSTARELIVYGGAAAGKSYAVAQKIIVYCLLYKHKKILVVRKTFPSLKLTCIELLLNLFDQYKVPYKLNKADWVLYTVNNNKIIFKALDDPEKVKSITDVDLIWVEEPTEISEKDYMILNMRLRGKPLKKGEYRQIILTFNPIDINHWLYRYFFERDIGARYKFTYKDNEFLDAESKAYLERLKEEDEMFYRIYALGEWGTLREKIYNNYEVKKIDKPIEWFDDIVGGVDFGYNNPNVFLLVGIKDQDIYVLDEIYKSKILNSEFSELIKDKLSEWGVNPEIYCDPSEPALIEELYINGLNALPADNNVKKGINNLKRRKIYIDPRCVNTIKEIHGYCYKQDRNGNILEEPVKFNDHAMDALRYATVNFSLDKIEIGNIIYKGKRYF